MKLINNYTIKRIYSFKKYIKGTFDFNYLFTSLGDTIIVRVIPKGFTKRAYKIFKKIIKE